MKESEVIMSLKAALGVTEDDEGRVSKWQPQGKTKVAFTKAACAKRKRDKVGKPRSRTKGRVRRRGAQTWAMLLGLGLALSAQGCKANLQRPYVDSMKATHAAVMADVTAGLYKPDASSNRTLEAWAKSNKDADEALAVEGK